MILILSGREIAEDIKIEFGAIPPAMLPVGNRPLLDSIMETIKLNNPEEKIVVSFPKNYTIPTRYLEYLVLNNVQVVFVESSFSLGKSLLSVLSQCLLKEDEGVLIHYGDTLLRMGLPPLKELAGKNVMYSAITEYNYSWLYLDEYFEGAQNQIFCGVIWLGKAQKIISLLITHDFDIYKVLKEIRKSLVIEQRDDWLDFGHVNTYYNSKTIVSTERAFNKLYFDKFSISKFSVNGRKLKAEALWFDLVPEKIVHNTPRLISKSSIGNEFSYKIEYLFNPTLSELYVYGAHSKITWGLILHRCFEFLKTCSAYTNTDEPQTDIFYNSLVNKNQVRLNQYLSSKSSIGNNIVLSDGTQWNLDFILDKCHEKISRLGYKTLVHGDFCFSNILFDFKRNDIFVIDPRGIDFNDDISNMGDIRYDLAKLMHSAIGHYDFIVSDNFIVNITNDRVLECDIEIPDLDLCGISLGLLEKYGYDSEEILAITITLFISMLPLHYDKPERQKAFIYTAIKLFRGLIT